MSSVIKKLLCTPCGHEWFPKTTTHPICCPNCRRADWKTGQGPRSILAVKRRLAAKGKAKLTEKQQAVADGMSSGNQCC